MDLYEETGYITQNKAHFKKENICENMRLEFIFVFKKTHTHTHTHAHAHTHTHTHTHTHDYVTAH